MSFFKNIFKKKKTIKCAVCGEAVQNEFANSTPSVKTEYLKLNGCYGLYIVHYNCSKKIKGAVNG